MKTLSLLTASALALTACQQAPPLSARLDCPATQGSLTRLSMSPDGKVCAYREADGAEVTLTRMPLKGDVRATLAPLEAELKALGGVSRTPPADQVADAKAKSSADVIIAEAKADAAAEGSETVVSVDQSKDGGEHARVDLPGIHIVTDGDKADVRVGPIHVDADGEGSTATIKLFRDVRLRGEALAREQRGFRATYVYTGEDLTSGYKFLGYEAAGPKVGPLTVAVVKSKGGGSQRGDMYDDVKKLVRRNGGV